MISALTKIFATAGIASFVTFPGTDSVPGFDVSMQKIAAIPLPHGFVRVSLAENSFGSYLRNLPLRKDRTVYLFNKQPKANQSLHYAVIDMSTGEKDLQQCADVIMRIRAEYFFSKKQYDSICFGKKLNAVYKYVDVMKPGQEDSREILLSFLEKVFVNCGTYTLEDQLKPVPDFSSMQPGDVLIKGGSPGHAEMVADMAIEPKTGKKIYLLVEGYMPAQDMHILINPLKPGLGPWYELNNNDKIVTASWVFAKEQLRHW